MSRRKAAATAQTQANGAPRRELADAEQLAEHLGVSVWTIYSWRKTSYGPAAIKVGNSLRWRWSDVDAWLDAQQQQDDSVESIVRPPGRKDPTGLTTLPMIRSAR